MPTSKVWASTLQGSVRILNPPGPTSSAVKLGIAAEEWKASDGTDVRAPALVVMAETVCGLASEGALCSVVQRHVPGK